MTLRLSGGEGDPAPKDIAAIIDVLRGGWAWLAAGGLIGLFLAVAVLWSVPPVYKAVMIVGPTARTGSAAMGARVPMLSGRESALTAAEPGAGDESLSDFARYLELFGAGPVAEQLARDPVLMRRLFPERWDAAADRWRPPTGVSAMARRSLLALVGRGDWVEPDGERVAHDLHRRLAVDILRSGPMRRITLSDADRSMALALLGRIASATDDHLRAEAARRSAAQIAHIKARLSAVTLAEHRQALNDLLLDQERVAMMIGVDLPFAADVIQQPSASVLPDWPDPALMLPLGLVAGVITTFFGLLARRPVA
ncbi:hypothetical protein [Azospirillum picis]|uniref:Polysaccharide chain length determinant N-terminal domain-containing protein n=1 Tax=Azospirillum picis TaxID=488438 RepID=A0ABU0MGN1_9PROT|nr:hypothetical protein [Azospirillum picis]MBP2298353.1 hypothetical protein [Azospirillum picis]MDQ0532598.1 hypothetical protein [Azospirillum picis]